MSDDLVTIASFNAAQEAWLVRGLLNSEGIPCVILDEIIGTMSLPFSGPTGGIRLQVPASRADEAQEVLKSLEAQEDADKKD